MSTAKARKKQNIRKAARRKAVAIWRRCGKKCWWCNKYMVVAKTIRKPIRQTASMIYWHDGTRQRSALKMTIDHLLPLDNEMANHESFLVASCYPCNHKRAAATQEKQPHNLLCKRCKQPKENVNRRHCKRCREYFWTGKNPPTKLKLVS